MKQVPKAILKSFEMDPDRKVLYVEGKRDRLFFEYILENKLGKNVLIREISTVELPDCEGGEKGRLMFFAHVISNSKIENLKFFTDADYDLLLEKSLPPNIITTDYKDLEAYLYEEDIFLKFILLGLATDKISVKYLKDKICNCRILAYLRIINERYNYHLPINETNKNFSRYFSIKANLSSAFDYDKYITTLLQKINRLKKKDDVLKKLEIIKQDFNHIPIKYIVHGKDVINLLKEIAHALNLDKKNVEKVFWTCFDKSTIPNYTNLATVLQFLKN